jgi:acetyl-CoA carboxylase carboxyl transferase subunit alpha
MSYYLDFEKPIQELDEQILEIKSLANPDSSDKNDLKKIESKRKKVVKEIFSNLNRWQRVQLARHPERPYSLDYINSWSKDFVELHGDRAYGDDNAIVCGIGSLESMPVVFVGQQKGRNTKDNLYRNFGYMNPEGYRKALRVMRLAEKFQLPIITLIDTPGAYPGIGAEERGQGEAIAKNLFEISKLRTPIISVVIGEGASGGALGIGICDKMLMLENTWYSVITPEGCASILWHDASKAKAAAEALKLTPDDLVEMGICDEIIKEPFDGAHRNPSETYKNLSKGLVAAIQELKKIPPENLLDSRIDRYAKLGEFTD